MILQSTRIDTYEWKKQLISDVMRNTQQLFRPSVTTQPRWYEWMDFE
jgi:hypothetical protein